MRRSVRRRYFFEFGSNMNHFDFDLLKFHLEKAGFSQIIRQDERGLWKSIRNFNVEAMMFTRCMLGA